MFTWRKILFLTLVSVLILAFSVYYYLSTIQGGLATIGASAREACEARMRQHLQIELRFAETPTSEAELQARIAKACENERLFVTPNDLPTMERKEGTLAELETQLLNSLKWAGEKETLLVATYALARIGREKLAASLAKDFTGSPDQWDLELYLRECKPGGQTSAQCQNIEAAITKRVLRTAEGLRIRPMSMEMAAAFGAGSTKDLLQNLLERGVRETLETNIQELSAWEESTYKDPRYAPQPDLRFRYTALVGAQLGQWEWVMAYLKTLPENDDRALTTAGLLWLRQSQQGQDNAYLYNPQWVKSKTP